MFLGVDVYVCVDTKVGVPISKGEKRSSDSIMHLFKLYFANAYPFIF